MHGDYSMFHVTCTTFKFNKNQLGTVSANVMISVPWSNQRAQSYWKKNYSPKNFSVREKDHKLDGIRPAQS